MVKIIFRDYIEEDWNSICNVFLYASREEIKGCCDEKALRPLEDYKQSKLLREKSIKICACHNDKVIGYIAFSRDTLSILSLYLLPEYMGKKIGKTLLQLALINLGLNIRLKLNNNHFIKDGVIKQYPSIITLYKRVVNVICMSNNVRAVNLYKSYGFIPVHIYKEILNGYPCLYTKMILSI